MESTRSVELRQEPEQTQINFLSSVTTFITNRLKDVTAIGAGLITGAGVTYVGGMYAAVAALAIHLQTRVTDESMGVVDKAIRPIAGATAGCAAIVVPVALGVYAGWKTGKATRKALDNL